MDWKELLGSAYADGMTDDECRARFSELYVSKADHDREIAKSKGLINSYSAQIAEQKRKERERLSEEERKAIEEKERWDALETQNKQLQRELKIRELMQSYASMGFDEELARTTAIAMYDGDTATVLSNQKIQMQKRDAELKRSWEKEYAINPPAGNGSGKTDYSAEYAQAQESGDMAAMAHFARLQAEANRERGAK